MEEALTRSLAQGLAGRRCSELIVHPHSSRGTLSCQARHTHRSPAQQACSQLSNIMGKGAHVNGSQGHAC